jgi:hypothetical protein
LPQGSNHVANGPDATTSQRHPHVAKGGFDCGFQVSAFHFSLALNFENGLAVKKVRFHNCANLGRQIGYEGDGEFGGGGDHDEGM